MISDSAATNSYLVLNAPIRKVQDLKQMKTTGAVSWVWDHFSKYDPKYYFLAVHRTVYMFGTLDLDRTRTWTSLQDTVSCTIPHYECYLRLLSLCVVACELLAGLKTYILLPTRIVHHDSIIPLLRFHRGACFFLSHMLFLIDPTSLCKSWLNCISQQKIARWSSCPYP